MSTDASLALFFCILLGRVVVSDLFQSLSTGNAFLLGLGLVASLFVGLVILWELKSAPAKARRKIADRIQEIPLSLRSSDLGVVRLGEEVELGIPIFLPDSVRLRHTHIIGATGSGKTESVILNFIKQDVARGLGTIILDAKGDASFLKCLREFVPEARLRVFDLGSENSLPYDPLSMGSSIEAAQRLFSSLNWSEEYYKSKALSALQLIFYKFAARNNRNPTLIDLAKAMETPDTFSVLVKSAGYEEATAKRDFLEISGLRDQINTLCIGHLSRTLSGQGEACLSLKEAADGKVLYFRLQSLLSPQLVGIVGRLVINQLNFLAGSAHRLEGEGKDGKLIPTYLDEFASFACPEFADLISKARSALMPLHFSHQSIGDLEELPGFLSRVTDNSATKIVFRVNDPDTADFFSRSFGTKLYQKITQRITNVKELDTAEAMGEGSQREAHQFRASPDMIKTLPTGEGAVLIAHGERTPHGASTVFRIRFPRLKGESNENGNDGRGSSPINGLLHNE